MRVFPVWPRDRPHEPGDSCRYLSLMQHRPVTLVPVFIALLGATGAAITLAVLQVAGPPTASHSIAATQSHAGIVEMRSFADRSSSDLATATGRISAVHPAGPSGAEGSQVTLTLASGRSVDLVLTDTTRILVRDGNVWAIAGPAEISVGERATVAVTVGQRFAAGATVAEMRIGRAIAAMPSGV